MRRRPSASLKLSCTQQGTITILELDSFTDGVGSYTMTLSQLLFVFTDEVLLTDPPPIPSASPPHVLSVNTFIIGYDLRCWSEKNFFKMLLGSTPSWRNLSTFNSQPRKTRHRRLRLNGRFEHRNRESRLSYRALKSEQKTQFMLLGLLN